MGVPLQLDVYVMHCTFLSYRQDAYSDNCLGIPPPEAIFIGGLGAVLSGGIVYLNVRLYSAVQEVANLTQIFDFVCPF